MSLTFGKTKFDGLTSVAANAAAASRTLEIATTDVESLGFAVQLVRVAATSIDVTLWKSADDGTTYSRVPSTSVVSGTGTSKDYTQTKAVSGDDTLWVDVDVGAATKVKFIAGATTGGASDLISVQVSGKVWL